ncbi:Cut9-interacting protein scn1 [Paramyrothecium foliicola]|nr:Cut9-interacting protein scn1 [Paramyrothecium foliicola]
MCGQNEDDEGTLAPDREPQPLYADSFPWHLGVFDVHNHVGERRQTAEDLPNMKARAIAIMSTRTQDQPVVADIAAAHGLRDEAALSDATTKVVAGYGWHPWFSHELYDDALPDPTFSPSENVEDAKRKHYQMVLTPKPEDATFSLGLPTPKPLSVFIAETKRRLLADPTAVIGEIGLDKAFRLPMPWQPGPQPARDPARTPGGRERRPLSKQNIEMSHQKTVLLAQLKLAGELNRAVSVHGVQVHGLLYDCLSSCWKDHELKGKRAQQKQAKQQQQQTEAGAQEEEPSSKPYPPRICLHSFSGKSDAVKQYLKPSIPCQIFFSFSKRNNFASDAAREKAEDAIRLVPDDRVLVESDLHTAGDAMDAHLEDVYRSICAVKGWSLEHGVSRMASNFRHFIFGNLG